MMRILIIIGFLITMLTLGGYSRRAKENERCISNEMASGQINSVKAFNNKHDYKELTELIIDTCSDVNLLQLVFDKFIEDLPFDYEQTYERVMTWNKSRQIIYVISVLEAEVNNGGYNQFYYNSSGQFYKLTPEVLRLVSANELPTYQKSN